MTDKQLGRPVIEEPKRSILPYLAAAIGGAAAFWLVQQLSSEDTKNPTLLRVEPSPSPDANASKGDLRTLFSADDYPADAQRNGEQGLVQARLTIDTNGRVSSCAIIRSSGHSSLDNATCSILQRRARFRPAHDEAGSATTDTVISPPIIWRLEG